MSKVLKFQKRVPGAAAASNFQPKSISHGLKLIAPDLIENAGRHLVEFLVISFIFLMIFFGIPLIGAFLNH